MNKGERLPPGSSTGSPARPFTPELDEQNLSAKSRQDSKPVRQGDGLTRPLTDKSPPMRDSVRPPPHDLRPEPGGSWQLLFIPIVICVVLLTYVSLTFS